jgi:hypothetical protein
MIGKLLARIKRVQMTTILRISAACTIIALAMMVWSLFVPTPLPVMLAMSAGQAFGMLAFGLYLTAIVIDLRRDRRARRESQQNIGGT